MKSLEDTLLDARAMLGHKRSGQCANEIAADIDQLLLQGEFAKDDNINAQFDQAVENIKAVWEHSDINSLKEFANQLSNVIWDRELPF